MNRRRAIVALATALACVWLTAGIIHAITNGQPDGENHPYVGLLVFYAPDVSGNDVAQWLCSGSLLSPTVVLTAGHCTDGASYAKVWFGSNLSGDFPPPGGVDGDTITHPEFSWRWEQGLLDWDAVDTGVVVLRAPVTASSFAALPDAGLVDNLAMKTKTDAVGYGVQYKLRTSGKPGDRWVWTGTRYYAPSQIVASENRNSDLWLKLTANPGQGKGGVCFGDSGGPILLARTNVLLATSSFVANMNCSGVTYSNRVDRPVVLDWITQKIKEAEAGISIYR